MIVSCVWLAHGHTISYYSCSGGGAGYRGVKSLFLVFPSLIREVGRLTSFFRFHLKIAKFSARREFDIATIRL